MRLGFRLLAGIAAGLLAAPAMAQPAAAPASAPALHKVTVPAGFKLIEAESRRFMAEAADEAWIRAAVKNMQPTTQPTTMPGDLLTKLASGKADISKRLAAELGLADASSVQKMITDTLEPRLKQLETFNPPLIYLVTTSERLKETVKGGWTDPQFYYNRAADEFYYQAAQIAFDQDNGDAIIPAFYEKDEPPAKRSERLVKSIHNTEGSLGDSVMRFGINLMFEDFLNFVARDVFEPLKLKPDQIWLTSGVSNVIAVRYSSELSGVSFKEQMTSATAPSPNNPLATLALDLSNPMDLASMREEAKPAYADLFRSRSMRAVAKLTEKGGSSAITKVLTALRKQVPADGAGLVQLIKTATNVDLTDELKGAN